MRSIVIFMVKDKHEEADRCSTGYMFITTYTKYHNITLASPIMNSLGNEVGLEGRKWKDIILTGPLQVGFTNPKVKGQGNHCHYS